MNHRLASLCLVLLLTPSAWAQEEPRDFNAEVEEALAEFDWPGMIRLPIGVTPRGTIIWALMDEDALDYRSEKLRYVVVGGVAGNTEDLTKLIKKANSYSDPEDREFSVAIVPIADPDGWVSSKGDTDTSDADSDWSFPPGGAAYNNPDTAGASCIWRFVGWFAPDILDEIVSASDPVWEEVRRNGGSPDDWPENSLAAAADTHPVAGIERALSFRIHPSQGAEVIIDGKRLDYSGLTELYTDIHRMGPAPWSPLRKAIIARLDRSPTQVATELTEYYGDHLNTVMYQPALALVARLRLGELTSDSAHREQIETIVAPYTSGEEPTFPDNPHGSQTAGHLVFAELARITGKQEYVDLVLRAADFGFDEDGNPLESMPFHHEMSDAVFMGCPILTAAGRLTGEMNYFEMALRHLNFIREFCVREDGLYRHSPLCEAAWGRGNAFPMLGLALGLTDIDATLDDPTAHGLSDDGTDRLGEIRTELLSAYQSHLTALLQHQDPTGTWHQVIDRPESYRELSCTCMIAFAILRGLNQGWLEADTYRPVVEKAWDGIKVRVGPDGTLFDVCTGTGKQQTLRDYFDREAILGKDERGGAMALLVSVEMAAWMAGRRPELVD
ncbi:MAG: hypothetical protein DWQ45_03650 [Planctomycetota bacterium]|nr:MAG: hypothetical protein DWQ41_16820 [Planctomycetota bacterium]REK38946.1 MAG: hypothetical protein DWQ45_03650 [Planctomycetota bacterium]